MDYIDKVSVIDFAQLALDCYNSSDDNDIRTKEFKKLWYRVDQWPRIDDWKLHDVSGSDADAKTGFYAAFYLNNVTSTGVIAIRGTASLLDGIADINYVLDKLTKQYDEALTFVKMIQTSFIWSGVKNKYVCGHSLGGIVAKMIAPRTGLNTVAFNSPGVVEYLKKRHLPWFKVSNSDAMCSIPTKQTIITYCANGCPIGNLRHDNDVGPYKWLPVLGEARIPDNLDRIDGKNLKKALLDIYVAGADFAPGAVDKGISELPGFDKAAIDTKLTQYHSMRDMYVAIKQSKYKNDRI